MSKIKKIPDGYHAITPSLIVKDGIKAIDYYKKVFDAKDKGTMMTPDGKSIAHAELEIGDSKIMLSDEFPEMNCLSPASIGGSPISLYLYVEDVDKTFNLAVSEGASVLYPVADQFWGDRHGSIKDPFGHIWSISTHVKDLAEEEIKKAAAEAFSKMSK
ncbi:MAG TPA: VOC family protein [Candidatus Saccharimonadales bacterium]|nr:VOC family protein [Candidatus Saccharimonadales bacterium]